MVSAASQCIVCVQSLPIWASLSKGKTELYRDIQAVFLGNSPVLEEYTIALSASTMFTKAWPLYGNQAFAAVGLHGFNLGEHGETPQPCMDAPSQPESQACGSSARCHPPAYLHAYTISARAFSLWTICRQFGRTGPFWGRQYLFWHDRKPLTVIHEVFSTSLERYLGPCSLSLSS